MDSFAEFLKEYQVICEKHNIIVTGCGCCDSPFLVNLTEYTTPIEEHIEHLKENIDE